MSLFIRVAAISNGGLCCRGTKNRNDDHDDARSDHDGSWRERGLSNSGSAGDTRRNAADLARGGICLDIWLLALDGH